MSEGHKPAGTRGFGSRKPTGATTPADALPSMTANDDTRGDAQSPTDEERYLSPLGDGAQLIKNPTRTGRRGETTFDQEAATPLFTATGQYLYDKPGHVDLTISVDAAQFRLTLDTETARTLAADLDIAARGAEDPEEIRDEL